MDLWLSPHDARVRSLRKGGVLHYGTASTPFGECTALVSGPLLLALRFSDDRETALSQLRSEWPEASLQHSPDAGELARLAFDKPDSIPVMAIGTPFQLSVWEYLRRSSSAVTMTYGEVAKGIGRPTAARAVGRAVGFNGIAVLIPCHRVISRGKLTGYRWGLDRKKALLAWELSRKDPLRMPF